MYKEILIENITLTDNKISDGILLTKEQKSKSIIICAHGLGGNAANFMNLKIRDHIAHNNLDFDCFRFDFYNFNDQHRNFLETTIATQVNDLNSIINHFAELYETVYLMATSYGALTATVLNSKKLTKQILVDPSYIIDLQWQNAKNETIANNYIVNTDKHIPMLFNPAMQAEGLAWNAEKSQQALHSLTVPTLILQANSIHYKLCAKLDYSNKNITTNYLEHANHSFTKLNNCEDLCKQIFSFI